MGGPTMPVRAAPETAFAVYTILMALITAGFLVWWLLRERERGPALPLLMIGGAISGLMEPWLDNVVLYRWPPEQKLAAFEAFGRTIPVFVIVGYAWFCGALIYIVGRAFATRLTAARVWTLLGIVALVDFLAIGLSAWLGVSGFFGDPPLNIGGYPLWWAAFDGLDVILGGAIVLLLAPRLPGWSQAWLILVPPVALGAASGAVGWPVSIAIHSDWSAAGTVACALATIGLCLACVHLIARGLPLLTVGAPDRLPEPERVDVLR